MPFMTNLEVTQYHFTVFCGSHRANPDSLWEDLLYNRMTTRGIDHWDHFAG